MKTVFGLYIATQILHRILRDEVNLGDELRCVTILFSDIRTFSTMSEQRTPQQVVSILNDYFSEMVEAVFEHGRILDKYIGDGLMAVLGSIGDRPDHARPTFARLYRTCFQKEAQAFPTFLSQRARRVP